MEENFNVHLGRKLRMRRLSLGLTMLISHGLPKYLSYPLYEYRKELPDEMNDFIPLSRDSKSNRWPYFSTWEYLKQQDVIQALMSKSD